MRKGDGPIWVSSGYCGAAEQHLGAGLHPIVAKGRLHLRDRWAFDPVVGVAPMILGLAIFNAGDVGDADAHR